MWMCHMGGGQAEAAALSDGCEGRARHLLCGLAKEVLLHAGKKT
jgi:hypothetical protein